LKGGRIKLHEGKYKKNGVKSAFLVKKALLHNAVASFRCAKRSEAKTMVHFFSYFCKQLSRRARTPKERKYGKSRRLPKSNLEEMPQYSELFCNFGFVCVGFPFPAVLFGGSLHIFHFVLSAVQLSPNARFMTQQNSKGLSTELKVGAVTLASFVLLIAGILVGKGLFARASFTSITILAPSSGGVEIGSPTLVNGIKRGAVTSVKPISGGVAITASMDDVSDLRKDALARIMILEITGGRKIEITPGVSAESLGQRDTIRGLYTGDIADLIAVVGEIAPELKRIVARLDTIAAAGTELLADGSFVADARSSLKNLAGAAETANALLERNKSSIQNIVGDVGEITRELRTVVKTNAPKADRLILQLDSTLVETRKLIASGDKAVGSADGLVKNVDDLLADIKNGDNFLRKFLYDKEFNTRLDSTVVRLQRFLDNLPQDGINVNVRLGSRP
jgi:ABC-type transporter Mla subunit MlaD